MDKLERWVKNIGIIVGSAALGITAYILFDILRSNS